MVKDSEQREKQAAAQAELQGQISEASRKPDMWASDKIEVDPASAVVVVVFVVIAVFGVLFAIFGTWDPMLRLTFPSATALVTFTDCNAEDDWDGGHKAAIPRLTLV